MDTGGVSLLASTTGYGSIQPPAEKATFAEVSSCPGYPTKRTDFSTTSERGATG